MHIRPNAKINLGLFIKGRRADGYHLLETVYYPVSALCDDLYLELSDHPGCQLEIEGLPVDGHLQDNLVWRAYGLLKEMYPDLPGVNIRLHKQIPAGSGLGGGSSDAAFTLAGLNKLFGLELSRETLAPMAARLGADVPFFLYNHPLLARGIGTDFEQIELELPYRIEIRTSALHSSTAMAYQQLDYTRCDPRRKLAEVIAQPVEQWKDTLINDLEASVFKRYPQLAKVKAELYEEGAVYAAMSGSGSAVFGLFPQTSTE